MKEEILTAVAAGLVIPLTMLTAAAAFARPQPQPEQAGQTTAATEESAAPAVQVPVLTGAGTRTMELEGYLLGVVLAEMPPEFEPEALKAQAVVARTYTCKRMQNPKHGDGAVCMDSTCCQGYITTAEYLAAGGTQESVEKVRRAVEETAGQVLTYEGALIDATYFSCSGGSTEDAQAVWGQDVPYLQAVESPGEEDAPRHRETLTFTAAEFAELTGCGGTGDPAGWFGPVTETDGGSVASMEICGRRYTGVELRKMLGLRSAAFTVTVVGQTVTVQTRGSGHRVGMSQYGAQAMAQQGSSYGQILAHYYQGTRLELLPE